MASSFLVMINYINGLIFTPYKTIRKIAKENDWFQIGYIFFLVYIYFIYANIIRSKTLHPFIISAKTSINISFFILLFFLTVSHFYLAAKIFIDKKTKFQKYLFTFFYSLIPTLIWFFTTSTLYWLFPPPRSTSILGLILSSIFIIFSVTLLFWKINLFYLSIRFSSKANFYQIIIMIIGFLFWFIPISYWLYQIKVFRIPFI